MPSQLCSQALSLVPLNFELELGLLTRRPLLSVLTPNAVYRPPAGLLQARTEVAPR